MPDNDHGPVTYSEIYRQIVVTLRRSASFTDQTARLFEILKGVQYQPIGEIEELWMVAIQLAESEDVSKVLRFLGSSDNSAVVEDAEQNRPMRSTAAVNDPLFWDQWALPKISAESAWAHGATAPQVIVAIIDTGISTTHPDLVGHLWDDGGGNHGHNVLTNTGNVADADGHGTLLAGTIGAISNNALGIAATEWPIRLMSVKFHDVRTPPTGWNATRAIVWAVVHGAYVINASWDVGLPLRFLKLAIVFANLKGVVFVAAAGNDGLNNDILPTYPASYDLPNVIAVMASDEDDDKPGFSNYGRMTVHLAAPGIRILSTHAYLTPPPQWRRYSGTSSACAHVTNAAALLKALNATWTPTELREHLIASVDKSPWLACVANGRLNLEWAVRGPLRVTAPQGGDQWNAGTSVQVTWNRLYQTPRCTSVRVLLSENGGPYGLLKSGQPNSGACSVTAPNRSIPNARLKLQSEQGHGLFHESGIFAVVP
jgi:subtilisin family serine protease